MKNFELLSFDDPESLASAAASAWLDEIETANRKGKQHFVALSGGRITLKFFALVVEQAEERAASFNRVHFFWADERCVPPTDAESNFHMAQALLFAPLKILESQIHRVRGEDSPETAAKAAEMEICRIAPLDQAGQPVLDLIFLGLGEDGHVASLFPGEPDDVSTSRAVYRAVMNSPKPPPQRVTLGFQAIAAANKVWMLASGAGKTSALEESLSPGGVTPFARILRIRAQTRVFTDIETGSLAA